MLKVLNIMIINYNHDNRGGVMLTNLCQIIVDFFISEDIGVEEHSELNCANMESRCGVAYA